MTVIGSGPGPGVGLSDTGIGLVPEDKAWAWPGPLSAGRGTVTRTTPSFPACLAQAWRRASRLAEARDMPLAWASSA